MLGERGQLRAAGIRETEQPRDLVERFARRVVERLADDPVTADAGHFDQLRVPARHEQRQERKVGPRLLEHAGQKVPLEMVHRDRGDLQRVGQRRRKRTADHQGADQARPGGIGDGVEVPQREPGLAEHVPHHGQQLRDVIPGRQLRHDPAKSGVDRDLARQALGPNTAARLEDGHACLVAAGFDP